MNVLESADEGIALEQHRLEQQLEHQKREWELDRQRALQNTDALSRQGEKRPLEDDDEDPIVVSANQVNDEDDDDSSDSDNDSDDDSSEDDSSDSDAEENVEGESSEKEESPVRKSPRKSIESNSVKPVKSPVAERIPRTRSRVQVDIDLWTLDEREKSNVGDDELEGEKPADAAASTNDVPEEEIPPVNQAEPEGIQANTDGDDGNNDIEGDQMSETAENQVDIDQSNIAENSEVVDCNDEPDPVDSDTQHNDVPSNNHDGQSPPDEQTAQSSPDSQTNDANENSTQDSLVEMDDTSVRDDNCDVAMSILKTGANGDLETDNIDLKNGNKSHEVTDDEVSKLKQDLASKPALGVPNGDDGIG